MKAVLKNIKKIFLNFQKNEKSIYPFIKKIECFFLKQLSLSCLKFNFELNKLLK